MLILLAAAPAAMAITIGISDGGSHILDSYQFFDIILDDIANPPDPGTHVDVLNPAIVNKLTATNNSTIDMSGGQITTLAARGNSTIDMAAGIVTNVLIMSDNSVFTMSGGLLGNALAALNNSNIEMIGGQITSEINAGHNSSVTISGGNVHGGAKANNDAVVTVFGGLFGDIFLTRNNGTIYLNGTGFAVNGTPVSSGARLSEFGTLVPGDFSFYTGTVTGILSDGSALDQEFKIYNTDAIDNAEIIVIPEPATLLLLGLGGLVLRKRN